MDLKDLFIKAVSDSKELPARPSNNILLQLYSLYKQAEIGDAPTEGPSNPFDIIGRAKHDAWQNQKGKSKEQAMQEYVALINELKG